jgi:putative thioredoxin
LEPEAEKLVAELQFKRNRLSGGDLAALEQKVNSAPADQNLRLQWAEALLAAGDYEAGLSQCLNVVEAASGSLRDKARQLMVDTFKVLGESSPLTTSFRRSLSLALY